MACGCGGHHVPTESGDVQYWHSDNCKAWSPSRDGEKANAEALKASELNALPGANPGPGIISEPFYTLNKAYKERKIMKQYLQMKVDVEDWHGVQDAASDLRDVDNWINGYNSSK